MANKKHRSINDYTAQQIRNNENVIELLSKLDQALNSNEEYVTATTTDSVGNEVNSQITSIGYFKQRLDQAIKMMNKLASIDNSASSVQFGENSFKRIITEDLNQEPNAISELNPVTTFRADPNWIFDTFLNPIISVEIDLTDRISSKTRNVQSRRFIVEFEQTVTLDANNNEILELTPDGEDRLQEFNDNYKNQSNIDIVEFVQWLDQPGVISDETNYIDEDYFRIEPNRLQFKGDFDVTSTEIDTVNNRLWYILDSLTYYDISNPNIAPKPIELEVGDLIKVNPNSAENSSATVYKVIEISTITSEFRVRFEQVFGEEPIPIRIGAISYYSDKIPQRSVKVSVGFDEHCVIFLRQLNDTSNILATQWSPGIGFYTNELRLDDESGQLFDEYYEKKVYDYGLALEDLVQKKIPNFYGEKPPAPVLDESNFQVVQINQHLTQTVEAERIRDLHNKKNDVTSQIKQISSSIEKQNRRLSTETFESAADRKRVESEITKLSNQLNNKNQSKVSAVQEILANKKNLNKIPAEFRLRGFWAMPDPIRNVKTKPQETVQFEVWYRKLSKSGDENPIMTINDLNNSSAQNTNQINNPTSTNVATPKTTNASFSNWQKFKTDARKRKQDKNTGEWFWQIEDVADADTPNINQLDISILPGEKIQIKVIGLSEVGWPETPVESDPSNTIEIEFPDNLSNILNEDDFILEEAQADEIKVQFEQELETRGLGLHLNTAIRDVDIYYAHRAEAITSGFKDNNGRIINLYDQLLTMVNKINSLEEQINRAKGQLEIFLINNGNLTKVFNGNNLQYNINLEDYAEQTLIGLNSNPVQSIPRTYKNDLIVIEDFSILIKNSAQDADLGLLSYRGYGQPSGLTPALFAYDGNNPNATNFGVQATWIDGSTNIQVIDIPGNQNTSSQNAPRMASQANNQFVWLQIRDINGNYIYDAPTPNVGGGTIQLPNLNVITGGINVAHNIITSTEHNFGILSQSYPGTQLPYNDNTVNTIINSNNWKALESPTNNSTLIRIGNMGTTIHPILNTFNDITDTSTQLTRFIQPGDTNAITLPIIIFSKMSTASATMSNVTTNTEFIDDNLIGASGDMPVIYFIDPFIESSGKLQFNLAPGQGGVINVNDRIVLTGLTNTTLLPLNDIPVRVIGTPGDSVRVDFNVPNNFSQTQNANLIQIHKRYRGINGITNSIQGFYTYNVYGALGLTGDTKYVNSYVEVIPTPNQTPNPMVHNKKLKFYLEDENSIRPFEFQITFNIKQYKEISLTTGGVGGVGGGLLQGI